MISILERIRNFLGEKQTELYQEYSEGVSEPKNDLGAKSFWQRRALPGFMRSDMEVMA